VHPFYVGTQAHPELRSRPNRAHPLFRGLIGAALERQQATRLFEVAEAESVGAQSVGVTSEHAVTAGAEV
jgi:CTP synthase